MDEIISVLRVKNSQGNFIGIPALKGDKGDPGDPGTTIVATDENNDGNVVLHSIDSVWQGGSY